MTPATDALLIAGGAYLGTNLDNLVILSAFAASGVSFRTVALASGLTLAVILVVATVLSLVATVLPVDALRILGVIPLAMGVKGIKDLIFGREEDVAVNAAPGVMGVMVVMLSNSADTFAVLLPLLAETTPRLKVPMVSGPIVGWLAILGLLYFVTHSGLLRDRLAKIGVLLAPLVMIFAGLYVLLDTATDLA